MLYILGVFDCAGSFFQNPIFAANKGIALREFSDACNDKNSFLNKHPSDYTLFCLGEFDEVTGKFTIYDSPDRLGLALSFIKSDSVKVARDVES